MTRIKRINADFYPAFGMIAEATNCTNFHKFSHKLRLREAF